MFDKWIRTTQKPIGGGMPVKTLDCRDVERKIIDALEGRMEGVTTITIGNYRDIEGYTIAYNNDGYEFLITQLTPYPFNLEDWKYVQLEQFRSTLFVYVTDIKPRME